MSLNDWAYTPEEQDKLTKEDDLNEHIVIEGEIEGTVQQMKAMEVRFDDIKNIYQGLQEQGGMTRQVAQEARLVLPDFCNGAKDTEFTTVATHHNFKMALEELSLGMAAAVAAGFLAISALLGKFIGWLFGGSSSSGGGGGGGGGGGSRIEKSLKENKKSSKQLEKSKQAVDEMDIVLRGLTLKENLIKYNNGKDKIRSLEELLSFALSLEVEAGDNKSLKSKSEHLANLHDSINNPFLVAMVSKDTELYKILSGKYDEANPKESVKYVEQFTEVVKSVGSIEKMLDKVKSGGKSEELIKLFKDFQSVVNHPKLNDLKKRNEMYENAQREVENMNPGVVKNRFLRFKLSEIYSNLVGVQIAIALAYDEFLSTLLDLYPDMEKGQATLDKVSSELRKLKADSVDKDDLTVMKDVIRETKSSFTIFMKMISLEVKLLKNLSKSSNNLASFLKYLLGFSKDLFVVDDAYKDLEEILTKLNSGLGEMEENLKGVFKSSWHA